MRRCAIWLVFALAACCLVIRYPFIAVGMVISELAWRSLKLSKRVFMHWLEVRQWRREAIAKDADRRARQSAQAIATGLEAGYNDAHSVSVDRQRSLRLVQSHFPADPFER